ncbi:MAG: hypothetical protein ACP5GS_08375 [Nitrososphaeria archaeon]
MSGLLSWQISEPFGIFHASVLYWARAFSSLMPMFLKKKEIACKIKLKVNGNIVYVWAAVDVDTRELLVIKATKGRSAFDVMLFLKEVLKKCTNRQIFVMDRGPYNRGLLEPFGLIIIMKRLEKEAGLRGSSGL